MLKNYRLLLWALPLITSLYCKKNETENPTPSGPVAIKDSVLVDGLSFPWEITWGADNFIWMTERNGKISRVNPATGQVTLVHTIAEAVANGEGGLLGMALHPNFASTPQVFVVYNYTNAGNYREKVVRFNYNGTSLTNPLTIIDNINAASIHNGSRLLVVNDKLFITTGDANVMSSAQTENSPNGKILRLNLDGNIPTDNPVPGNPYWSWGHRNPQGLAYANGILYSSEHGPSNDDEINIVEKGRNYGWPTVQGFCDGGGEQTFCTANNVREPIKAWTPTIAVTGMDYYNNDQIPQWKNSLLIATLKNTRLVQLKLDADNKTVIEEKEFLNGKYGRMRDVCVAPDGTVYICTSTGNDKIIMVKGVPAD